MEEEIKISERYKARCSFRGVLLRFLEGYLIWEEWDKLISTEELKELTKPLVEFEKTLEKRYLENKSMDTEKFYNDPLIKHFEKISGQKQEEIKKMQEDLERLIKLPPVTDQRWKQAFEKMKQIETEATEEYVKGKTIDQFFEKALEIANSGKMSKDDFIKILYVLTHHFETSSSHFNSSNKLVVQELTEEGKIKFEEGKKKLMEAFDKQGFLSMAIGVK